MAKIVIKTEDNTKEKAEQIAKTLGLDLDLAINIFIKRFVDERGFPFPLTLTESNGAQREQVDETKDDSVIPLFTQLQTAETFEDVTRMVSEFVDKYEMRFDDFRKEAERALLLACCGCAFYVDKGQNYEGYVLTFLDKLEGSDRVKKDTIVDQLFQNWKSLNVFNSRVPELYENFCDLSTNFQLVVVKRCQGLFVAEALDLRNKNYQTPERNE